MRGSPQDGEDAAEVSPQERIAELEAEVAELKDRLIRAMAETENVRRRAQREVEDAGKYAITKFARDVLTIADNLERASQSVPEEAVKEDGLLKQISEGVEMTLREFANVMERHQIRKIDPAGERFDHNFHQAMMEVEDPSKPTGTVVQVLQPGYVVADRLLRPAMVAVSKGGPKPGGEGNGGNPGDKVDTTA